MSIRKILALLLAVVMACSLFVSPALAADDEGIVAISDTVAPKFSDADGHWAESAINRWAEEGIIQGYGDGTVNPGGNLKRAELAAILVRLLGLKDKAPAGTFSDVPADAWYADAVLKCAQAGIMLGDGTGKANPETTIDRQQTIVMVGRALGVKPAKGSSLDRFEDGDAVADWAAPYMIALTDMGILNGIPEGDVVIVAPTQDINRASTFTLLDKAIAKYITAPCVATVDDANKFVVINSAAEETGTVTVTGTTAGVVVATGTTDEVVLKNADVGTLKVDAPVDVIVSKGSSVDDLDANAAAVIDNKGDVTNLNTNADGVTFDGNKPTKVNTAKDVEPAKDSKGQVVTEKPTSSGSTGGSNRPATTPDASVTTALFHDTRADAQGVAEGTFVPDSALTDGYSVTSNKVNGVTEVTVNHKHIMQHQNAASPASLGYWTGYAVKAPEGTTSAKYAYLAEKVDEQTLTLTETPLEDIDQKDTMGLAAYYNVNTEPTKPYFVVEWTVTKEDQTTEKVTNWYHATFKTEKAPDAENVKLYEVHNKATFDDLPAAVQTAIGGWDTSRDEADVIADTDLPWLVVVYDRNIIGEMTFTAKVNGQEVDIKPVGAETMNATTIGKDKCYSIALTKFTNAAPETSGAYLYEDDATTVYAPTVVAVNGIASNAVTPVPKPGKQLFKVTFVDGDTTTEQSVVAVGNTATVTLPAAPARDGYYFTGWGVETTQDGQMTLYAAEETVTINGNTTFTAQYVEIGTAVAAVRPNGVAGDDLNFSYADAYADAGIGYANGHITVDQGRTVTLLNIVKDEGLGSAAVQKQLAAITQMSGSEGANCLYIGLAVAAPEEATTLFVDDHEKTFPSVDQAGHDVFQDADGKYYYISYYPGIKADGSVCEAKTWPAEQLVWKKGAEVIKVETLTVTRDAATPAEFTVNFVDLEGNAIEGLETQTVAYQGKAAKPEAIELNGKLIQGYYTAADKATAFDFAQGITANTTVYVDAETYEVAGVHAFDYACYDTADQRGTGAYWTALAYKMENANSKANHVKNEESWDSNLLLIAADKLDKVAKLDNTGKLVVATQSTVEVGKYVEEGTNNNVLWINAMADNENLHDMGMTFKLGAEEKTATWFFWYKETSNATPVLYKVVYNIPAAPEGIEVGTTKWEPTLVQGEMVPVTNTVVDLTWGASIVDGVNTYAVGKDAPTLANPSTSDQGSENASLSAAEPVEVAAPAPVVSSRGDDERVEEPVMD